MVQSLHVVGLGWFVGLIAVREWRLLRGTMEAVRGANPALLLLTGVALFFADAARYSTNPAFLVKMGLSVVGLTYEYALRQKWQARGAAITSLVLWSLVVVASRLVEDFDK